MERTAEAAGFYLIDDSADPLQRRIPEVSVSRSHLSEAAQACGTTTRKLHPTRGEPPPPVQGGELTQPGERRGEQGQTTSRSTRLQRPFFARPSPSFGETTQMSSWGAGLCSADLSRTGYPSSTYSSRKESESGSYLTDVDEELEAPLPLKDDYDWQNHNYFPLPAPCKLGCDFCHETDKSRQGMLQPGALRFPPQSCHCSSNWACPDRWCFGSGQRCSFNSGSFCGGVHVNVPQFSIPPANVIPQVKLRSPAGEVAAHLQQKTGSDSLPDECRNVFITHSVEISSQITVFKDFLIKQGFAASTAPTAGPIGGSNTEEWNDTYLKDPSTIIIVGISPRYKAETEGPAVDSHARHTKYIHFMMQNEFIQDGCLNFRFIPVLFLGASQRDVPGWLQNTRVYRWPQDSEDLLLRLLRVERYTAPPVPAELRVTMRPMPTSAATPLL